MTSIQDFISEEILLRYDAQDVNVYQSNLFHTRMLIKELELQNYLSRPTLMNSIHGCDWILQIVCAGK